MIRVLSIIHYPVFGGPHNRNSWVAPFLKCKGVETIVLLPDEPGNAAERLRVVGVDVVTIKLSRIRAKINPMYHVRLLSRFWRDVKRIRHLIRKKKINVVQINGLVNPQGAIAAKLEGIPVVWQILDTFPPMILRWIIMKLVNVMADVVMCTGKKVAEEHPGAVNFNERLILFYPPVDLSIFSFNQEKRKNARKDLGIPQDSFVIGNVGNVNLQKGHRTFIRAAAIFRKKIPEARFVILGAVHENHREFAESLWREADMLGLKKGENLIVCDPGTEVNKLEQAFDIFWMTSEPRSEGIPTAVEEAMAIGIPVVARRIGSIAEIVMDGKTGFVVEPFDVSALVSRTLQLYMSQSLSCTFKKAAREVAIKSFGIESCSNRHLDAYELALKSSGNKKSEYWN